MTHAGADTAIRARHDVLLADEVRVALEPLRDQAWIFDEVRAVTDHARNEHRAVGDLHVFEDAPLVFVRRVRGLDRIAAGLHAEDDIGDVFERDVELVRAVKAAPAAVQRHFLARDVAQRVVEHRDAQLGVVAVFRDGHVGVHLPGIR